MAVNKVVYGDRVIMDLTADTVSPETLLKGQTAHDPSGEIITGTCTYDSDTSDATIKVAEMLVGKTGYARGAQLVGTMPNNGAKTLSISDKAQTVSIPQGYHDGSGTASISETEQAKLISQNIREGVTILGVQGTMSGNESEKPQAKTVTPSAVSQEILPDDSYTCLSQVTVNPIPYAESNNAAGGITVTIG